MGTVSRTKPERMQVDKELVDSMAASLVWAAAKLNKEFESQCWKQVNKDNGGDQVEYMGMHIITSLIVMTTMNAPQTIVMKS